MNIQVTLASLELEDVMVTNDPFTMDLLNMDRSTGAGDLNLLSLTKRKV